MRARRAGCDLILLQPVFAKTFQHFFLLSASHHHISRLQRGRIQTKRTQCGRSPRSCRNEPSPPSRLRRPFCIGVPTAVGSHGAGVGWPRCGLCFLAAPVFSQGSSWVVKVAARCMWWSGMLRLGLHLEQSCISSAAFFLVGNLVNFAASFVCFSFLLFFFCGSRRQTICFLVPSHFRTCAKRFPCDVAFLFSSHPPGLLRPPTDVGITTEVAGSNFQFHIHARMQEILRC